MFDVLPASGNQNTGRPKWVTTSIMVHALVVILAVAATRGALEATRVAKPDEPLLLVFPRLSSPATEPRPAPAPEVLAEPRPEDFETLPTPSEMPPAIPPIDFTRRFDPRDLIWAGPQKRAGDDVVGTGELAGPGAIYEATSALAGFEPAVLLAQATPEYPATLLSAGLAGVVLVEFVIDTTGRVEAGSIRRIESSHRLFEEAARSAVLDAKFRPARLSGRPVRQITRQRIRFVPAP
jgi:TonB family protein